MTRPLDGIRVIDFSQIYAGPYATLLLAYLGADVIKIEPPGRGENLRRPDPQTGATNYGFLMLNAEKRSVTLNLKHPRGRELALKLLEGADILIENFGAGAMESYGLGYEQIAERFPRLIYASGKGYSSESRWARLGAFDNSVQAASGFIDITGFAEQRVKTSATTIDMGTGSHLVTGILAALLQRGKTGRGQKVDIAMLDVAVPPLTSALANIFAGRKFRRLGNRHWGTCPTDIYPSRDGDVLIFCNSDAKFKTLARLCGRPELADDPRCATPGSRIRIADELDQVITAWTRTLTRDEIISALIEADIPCAPVRAIEEVAADPELRRRGLLIDSEYPNQGTITVLGMPIRMSQAPAPDPRDVRRPPQLGEHTTEVLAALGLDASEITRLHDDGVI